MATPRATFQQIEDYGLIGDMHTCALVSKQGSLDFMCWPSFDSPSIFTRLLDRNGGHWSITPAFKSDNGIEPMSKQQYVACSNLLQTGWIHEAGVVKLTDFFALTKHGDQASTHRSPSSSNSPVLVRKLECLRGCAEVTVEMSPRPEYAKSLDRLRVGEPRHIKNDLFYQRLRFRSEDLPCIDVVLEAPWGGSKTIFHGVEHGVTAKLSLEEGNVIWFIMSDGGVDSIIDCPRLESDTTTYWVNWVRRCLYRGRHQEQVERTMLILKLLTYKPTGAIVAAATFSLPEAIGGSRNWDYRYSWVRDSSFTIYVFLKMGFIVEAEAYINFIFDRITEWHDQKTPSALPLMFGIRGNSDLPETVLDHLGGYKGTKPVRIGNAATGHTQLDIYGELMDSIYLYNKHGKPITYDQWVSIQHLINYVSTVWSEPDMSIWEVRGRKENFVYSKIMLWVAFDRALRLADKRCLPCPARHQWLETRDNIYDEIMTKGYNKYLRLFAQSYESAEVLDAAVLIMPLVFFIGPNDPRFLRTLEQILKSPEKGGLTSAGLVFRYNHQKMEDGVGGREGTFIMCTFWLIEALARAGLYDHAYLARAITMLENVLSFSNHLGMFSEEISISGEQLGNTPQAFSHLAFVSAAINLQRVTEGRSPRE